MFYKLRLSTAKYGFVTLVNFQNQFAYIWDALNRAFFIVIIMFIFVQLWSVVYESQGTSEIAGLTLANTIWYFLIAEVMELGRVRHDQNISNEVKDGTIAYTLIRPYSYLGYHFANGLGEVTVKMIAVFLLGLPIVLVYAGAPTIEPVHIPFVLLIMVLAVVMDFMIFSIIGLLAFVTEDVSSFRLVYQKLVFILGGMMIPLDFLPSWMQMVARVLPFNLTTYAPAKLFAVFEWSHFRQSLMLQIVWIGIIGTVLYWQYRWATTKLEVNGG